MLTGSAATRTRDWGWIHTSLPDSIIRHDVTNDFDSLTLVGPKAATAVQSLMNKFDFLILKYRCHPRQLQTPASTLSRSAQVILVSRLWIS